MVRRRAGFPGRVAPIVLLLACACSSKSSSRGYPVDGGAGTGSGGASGTASGGSEGSGGGAGGSGGGAGGSAAGGAGATVGGGPGGAAGSSSGGTSGAAADGGGSGGGGSGGTDGGFDCTGIAREQCTRLNDCFPYVIKVSYGSLDRCIDASSEQCTRALAAPGATAQNAELCISQTRAASCEQLLAGQGQPACYFKGTGATGAACVYSSQCQSGLCARTVDPASGALGCGQCAIYAADSASCANGEYCMPGSQCRNSVCARERSRGETCNDQYPCRFTLACVGGTCRDPLALGASCTMAPAGCDVAAGHYCSPEPNGASICKAFALAGPGQSCSYQTGQVISCTGGSTCSQPTMRCELRPTANQACSLENPCVTPLECIQGKCGYPDPAACP